MEREEQEAFQGKRLMLGAVIRSGKSPDCHSMVMALDGQVVSPERHPAVAAERIRSEFLPDSPSMDMELNELVVFQARPLPVELKAIP